VSGALRAARDELVADTRLRGAAFGRALANLVDHALVDASTSLSAREGWALVALGSYARRELCPGSDVDVMLLYAGGRRYRALVDDAARLWYPLWDEGFVLGHSARTVKEALSLADGDLDALTSLLDTRVVAGSMELAQDLVTRVHALAPKRRGMLVNSLADGAALRLERPGAIAEMLAPNLKEGGGGLRDIQAPGWVGWALAPGTAPAPDPSDPAVGGGAGWAIGVDALVAQGYLREGDRARLRDARDVLLDARVALHRVTGGRSDQLTLQDQDAVAALVGATDADAHVRAIGAAARSVVWITSDMWSRLRSSERGPSGRVTGERRIDDAVVVRDGRVALGAGAAIDTAAVLALAARGAELRVPFDRDTLDRIATLERVVWTSAARDDFIALLRAGRGAVPVFEALDHVDLLVRLLPEWEHVRARPQRNAYHRFTVDRHSLEAVAECAAVLDPDDPAGSGFDGDVARRARADVLLLAALLHDMGKGLPGDHSVTGVEVARSVAGRIGLDREGTEELAWLVRHHLLLADTATRRDLSDESTIVRFGRTVGSTERLDLLYVLTVGDSRATGPAAWSTSKASLVRELFSKTDALLEEGVLRMDVGTSALLDQYAELLAGRDVAVEWTELDDATLRCVVVAPDRTGLLATVAGTLAILGFDIASAAGVTRQDGMALEMFTGAHRFGRLSTSEERESASETLLSALAGELRVDEQLRERARRYRPAPTRPEQRDVEVTIDSDASAVATIVEVHAPDDVGLLARVAEVFADLGLDVTQAIVSTSGDRVVDVFYLRDAEGRKLSPGLPLDSLRATLTARLTTEVTLD
jgi:[protein-PII] uridylyltransferase